MQLNYGYNTPSNVPGGIADISNKTIVSRSNAEVEEGILLGIGVVQGKMPGVNVKYPDTSSTVEVFEGVTVDGGLTPVYDDGKVVVKKGSTVNVMQQGKVWVRCANAVNTKYGNTAYLVTDGEEKGYFTTKDDSGNTNKIELPGVRFVSGKSGDIAQVELSGAVVITKVQQGE